MKKKAIVAVICILPMFAANAQQDTTMNRTVIVENEYNPTVMDASKINVLPKVNEPKAAKKNIDYATSLRPVSAWNYQTMSPVVREWEADKAYRGYLRAGYGNYGNVDVKAGYLWDMTPNDRLNIAASLDGWNGKLNSASNEDYQWKSRLYNTKVGLDYKHAFKNVDFMLGGNFRSQVFNYMPYISPYVDLDTRASEQTSNFKQHQTLANVYAGLSSTGKDMLLQFAGEVGLNYFKQKYPTTIEEGNEKNLYLKGDVWKPLGDQSFGLMFAFNNFAYSQQGAENATSLELNPYYTYKNENFRVRIGAHVDWWGGADDELKVSPDVNIEYVFGGSYVLYAKAEGGMKNRSLYELTQVTPYWALPDGSLVDTYANDALVKVSMQPSYTTLNASAGLMASPLNGFWFNLTGGYQIVENDWCMMLDQYAMTEFVNVSQRKTKAAYGSAELKYDYKDQFQLALKGTYYHWDLDSEHQSETSKLINLGLKPEFELEAEAGMKVMEGLRVTAGYEYVKHYKGHHEPINNLHAGATYEVMKSLQVFGKLNNLLDKHYFREDGYPAQGLNVLAGLSFRF